MEAGAAGSRSPVAPLGHRWYLDPPPGMCSGRCCWEGQRILHGKQSHNPVLGEGSTVYVQHNTGLRGEAAPSLGSRAEGRTATTADLSGLCRLPKTKTRSSFADLKFLFVILDLMPAPVPNKETQHPSPPYAHHGCLRRDPAVSPVHHRLAQPTAIALPFHLGFHHDFTAVPGVTTLPCLFSLLKIL